MMKNAETANELRKGFETACLDYTINSNLAVKPEFISNNPGEGKKVFSALERELLSCDEFFISVAFITESGITPLLQTLKELENRNVSGKILTTDYLTFSEPKALEKLASLKNITLKMYHANSKEEGFHTKGYIFRQEDLYKVIIGSSNMTMRAITVNKEWNTKFVAEKNGEMIKEILKEFNDLWNSEKSLDFAEFIDAYKKEYLENKLIKEQQKIAKEESVVDLGAYALRPNKMQVSFIENLLQMRNNSIKKALLISATGTGKTYASAFAMRELNFKNVLFLVHRNQIAKQALKSFRKVFSGQVTMGLATGKHQEFDKNYIFATVQTMSKDENLAQFSPDHFDAIIYDEAHHTSAKSYKKIMDYFNPGFSLGMTATPDKRDDNMEGQNIYEIFEYNIAYEIRLQDALEENLLCPFHYFGITDISLNGANSVYGDGFEMFRYLTSDERVAHVMRQANYFGYSGERVKGLIFCSRVEEATILSEKLNAKGLRTTVLSGKDTEESRAEAIERLAGDECDDALDYILSVDIFSEGVDVPEINQIILLRPTQSPIVFIQQLGRGLRKYEGKEYVVILDFIGNYNNNFMIPIALSGDRTYNKDNIRRYVMEGARVIPGASTVHFDEISKKRIYQAIDNANFNDIRLIKENYINLRNKLGHIPKLMDFDRYGEMDVLRIFDNNSLGSYHKFLSKYEKDYDVILTKDEEKIIEFISKKLASGKRVHELLLLQEMLKNGNNLMGRLCKTLEKDYGTAINSAYAQNIINVMTNEFPTGTGQNSYSNCVFLKIEEQANSSESQQYALYAERILGEDRDYKISDHFAELLQNKAFYEIIKELVEFGLYRYQKNYSNNYQDTAFVLYEKYTYEDVCRLLGWQNNEVPLNIGGYKFDRNTKTFPVFINYDKAENISDTTKYEDHFTSNNRLIAISKSGRSITSEDVQNFLHAKERGIDMHLFVRKNKDDKISKEFYYLGRMTASGWKKEFTMQNTTKTAVEIEWMLDTPVREDIYEYIVNN